MSLHQDMSSGAQRRYVARTLGSMSVYVAINVAAIFGAFDRLPQPGRYLLAVSVAVPIIFQLWAMMRLMAESDEFVRGLLARRVILAWGITMSIATVWGFLESYANIPHAETWLIYPLFWGVFGLVSPFVRTTQ